MTDRRIPIVRSLAERFRSAIDREHAARRAEEERERSERARLARARAELLDALQAFGEAVGHFAVKRDGERLELRFEGRVLAFEADGERSRLKVVSERLEGSHALFLQDTLDRWVWSREDRYGKEHLEVLFDTGIEKLVAQAFGVNPLPPGEAAEGAGDATPGATQPKTL